MNLRQIDKLEESLKLELQANLEAIRLVRKLLKERNAKPATRTKRNDTLLTALLSDTVPASARTLTGNGSELTLTVEGKVVNAISKIEGRFTLSDLKRKLAELYPNQDFNRNTLSGIIFRQKNKAFKVITEGQGRRAGVYERM